MCDDGSEGELDQYYEQYGYYQSDDLGGYGGSDGTEGERDPAGGSYAEVRALKTDVYPRMKQLLYILVNFTLFPPLIAGIWRGIQRLQHG